MADQMKRAAIGAVTTGLLLLAAGCGDPEPDARDVLMRRCYDLGGVYFEYEATSAGAHVWCVAESGADIVLDGSE